MTLGWFLIAASVSAQTYDSGYYVRTVAGLPGFQASTNGLGLNARFYYPDLVVADAQSNLFVWDAGDSEVRKITPGAAVTTYASGTGISTGMALDSNGVIWSLVPQAVGSRLYSTTSNGPALYATNLPSDPGGLCLDARHNFYLTSSNQVWKLDTNSVLTVFAGSGSGGITNGNGTNASFDGLSVIVADHADNLYVCDYGGTLIRKIDQGRNVTTYAGQAGSFVNVDGNGAGASFYAVIGMCADAQGNLLVTSAGQEFSYGSAVRKIDTNANVTTLAGSFIRLGFASGPGTNALFLGVEGVCAIGGAVYVCDVYNACVRSITTNVIVPTGVPATLKLSLGGQPQLQLTGTVGCAYQILASPTATGWAWPDALPQTTVLLTNSASLWVDPAAVAGDRFYRALLVQ